MPAIPTPQLDAAAHTVTSDVAHGTRRVTVTGGLPLAAHGAALITHDPRVHPAFYGGEWFPDGIARPIWGGHVVTAPNPFRQES